MTDQELKDLVAGLAVKSDRMDAQLAQSQAKSDQQMAEIRAAQAATQAKSDQQMTELAQTLAQGQAQTRLEVEETARVVKEVSRRMGSMASNQGDVAEEFFYNSLDANPVIGLMEFDTVTPNLIMGSKQQHTEFDIVLVNGQSVALIEVKYKAHLNDLDQVQSKVDSYRRLRPEHKDYKIFAGLAGFSIPSDIVKTAHERGIFVLQRKGDVIEVDAQTMKAF